MDARFSSTSDYMLCRRKYMLGYIYELEHIPYAERSGSNAEIGTIGHAGMAVLYRGGTQDAALDAARVQAAKMGLADRAGETVALAAIRRYVAWNVRTEPDAAYKIVLTEDRLRRYLGTFHGQDVYITGQMDVVMEDEFGGLHVMDHKFTANFYYQAGTIELNRQGLTYAWLVAERFGRPVETFTLNLILRDPLKKDPSLVADRFTVYIDEEQLARHVEYLAVVAEEMVRLHQEGGDGDESRALPNPGSWCSWCSFKGVCPTMDQDPVQARIELREKFQKKEEL